MNGVGRDRRSVEELTDIEIMEISRKFLGLGERLENVGVGEYRMRTDDGCLRLVPILELKDEDIVRFVREEAVRSLTGPDAVRDAVSLLNMYIGEDISTGEVPRRSGLRRTGDGTHWFGE